MKCRLLIDADGPGGILPAGTVLDDPEAFVHCLPSRRLQFGQDGQPLKLADGGFAPAITIAPIAEPVDAECAAEVARWLGRAALRARTTTKIELTEELEARKRQLDAEAAERRSRQAELANQLGIQDYQPPPATEPGDD